jgi:hypothetical protein
MAAWRSGVDAIQSVLGRRFHSSWIFAGGAAGAGPGSKVPGWMEGRCFPAGREVLSPGRAGGFRMGLDNGS